MHMSVVLPDEVSAQLVPSRPGQCFATYLIHLGLQSFRPSLASPDLPAKTAPSEQLSALSSFPLQCGYLSGLLVPLADEARLSSSRRVLGRLRGSSYLLNSPSKRHGRL